jgi:hypothetical protein
MFNFMVNKSTLYDEGIVDRACLFSKQRKGCPLRSIGVTLSQGYPAELVKDAHLLDRHSL